jgi:FkbH-like protein
MQEDVLELQHQVEACLAQEAWEKANMILSTLWRQKPTPAMASYILSRCERLWAHVPLIPYRLALLRSFTIEPVVPLLRAAAFIAGIDLNVQVGEFNTYAQDMLDQSGWLSRFAPNVVILAVQARDIAPDLWERYPELSAAEIQAAVERIVGSFQDLVRVFRSHSQAHLIVHTLEQPWIPSQGILDGQLETGQGVAIQQINQELQRIASNHTGVYVLDYDALVARYGRTCWHDEGKWLTQRMPIAAHALGHLAHEWLRFLHPLAGRVCKALVTDLDNTLWGGVIGEDGMDGIKVGPEYPGAAYQLLQRAILDLYQRGIILAVGSKNNPEDALEALESHPGMLLRPQHFAALRINWNDKVQSIREIAAELNIGIEALAFLDDNPVERERVRTALPEVTVIDLPDDPMAYAQTLRESPVFERLTLSAEDQERGRYYAEQRQRVELEQRVTSLEDFYRSLQQEAEIAPVTPVTLARVAQLTQKTNQFNLTTRRYSEPQLAEMVTKPDWQVYTLRIRDRFGDSGLVGVAILHLFGNTCEIDTFLLSCRVIGRTVETAFVSFLAQQARSEGACHLRGWFFPTKKNVLAEDFYEAQGFALLSEVDEGLLWTLDLTRSIPTCPEWILLKYIDQESGGKLGRSVCAASSR